jgi:hypothetical protein
MSLRNRLNFLCGEDRRTNSLKKREEKSGSREEAREEKREVREGERGEKGK